MSLRSSPATIALRVLAEGATALPRMVIGGLILLGFLLIPACGSGSPEDAETGPGGEASQTSRTERGGEGPGAAGAGQAGENGEDGDPLIRGDTVLVSMDEYFIEMPDTVPAGTLHFRVRNAGFEEHNFEILRNDSLLWAFANPLNPAQTGVLDVTLEPGEYDILCTVSGHEGRGMQEVLMVTPPATVPTSEP